MFFFSVYGTNLCFSTVYRWRFWYLPHILRILTEIPLKQFRMFSVTHSITHPESNNCHNKYLLRVSAHAKAIQKIFQIKMQLCCIQVVRTIVNIYFSRCFSNSNNQNINSIIVSCVCLLKAVVETLISTSPPLDQQVFFATCS